MVPKENTCILQKTACICRKLQKIVGPFIKHPLIKGTVQRWFYSCTKKQMCSISREDKLFFLWICLQFTYSMSFSIFMIQPMTCTTVVKWYNLCSKEWCYISSTPPSPKKSSDFPSSPVKFWRKDAKCWVKSITKLFRVLFLLK